MTNFFPVKTGNGFTLIETMVAVTILMLAVAGPLFTASRAIVAGNIARDQLTASYLAQEGIEYVRAMRDNVFLSTYSTGVAGLSTLAWNNFLAGASASSIAQCRSNACTLDPSLPMGSGNGFSLSPCSGTSCAPLYVANGSYTTQSGLPGAVQTPFTRTVQVFDVTATDVRVVSTVSWNFHNIPYTVEITDHLTPWQ